MESLLVCDQTKKNNLWLHYKIVSCWKFAYLKNFKFNSLTDPIQGKSNKI